MVFDCNFNFSNHMSQGIKSTRVHARDLIPLLDLNTSVLLVNALVSRRLDYCNSLFLSLTDFELKRLRLVQNSLYRVVTHSSKFSHITHQLKKLYWLLGRYRVQFKIGLITYKILNHSQPVDLRVLIHPYTSSRNTKVKGQSWGFTSRSTASPEIQGKGKAPPNFLQSLCPSPLELFPFSCKKQSLCCIFYEASQNSLLQL